MKSEIHLTPETDEEVEFFERLAEARSYALEQGMDEAQIAQAFSLFATGMFNESDASTEEPQGSHRCPQCDTLIRDVESPGMGMDPVLVPCGCSVTHDELPQELYLDE